MKSAVFTIAAKNYLPCVRVLMESMRRWHPELSRIVILVDQVDDYFDPSEEDFELILSTELNLPNSDWFHFKYTILELSTAVKPYAFEFLYHRFGLDGILYLDPDIKVYNRLDCVLHSLERCSIVLTPHLTDALDDGHRPGELDILRSGTYNLGFIGITKTEQSNRFLKWWQARLYEHCVVDLDRGLFVDQRWIDLVPGLFSGVVINRQPGMNVAYWNLAHRRVLRDEDKFTVNGEPLYFFHFSGFDAENPMQFSKHQDRYVLSDLGDAAFLVTEYREDLLARGYKHCRNWPYAYGTFDNGFPIPDMGRPIHHEAPAVHSEVENPFSEEGFRAFLAVWNGSFNGGNGNTTGVTRLAYRIYRGRYDVQAVMPDVLGHDRVRFLEWMISSAKREHKLDDVFLEPVWDALKAADQSSRQGDSRHSEECPHPPNREFDLAYREPVESAGEAPNRTSHLELEGLRLLEEADNDPQSIHLTGIARAIYGSRTDLRSHFPSLRGDSGLRLLIWLQTYGQLEYCLDDEMMSAVRQEWVTALSRVDRGMSRLFFRALLLAMRISIRLRAYTAAVVSRLHRLRAKWYLWKYAPTRIESRVSGANSAALERDVVSAHLLQRPSINLVGYVRSEMGVGESARIAAHAARSVGIEVSVSSVDEDGPYRQMDLRAGPEAAEFESPITLYHVNADQTPSVFSRLSPHIHSEKYNIGYWAWELNEFPDRWTPSFTYYQEVWTPSSFCLSALAMKSPVPVVKIPHAVTVDEIATLSRADFGLSDHEFVFLTFCDMLSVYERKNPAAVVKAFIQEFGARDGFRLVVKVNHGEERSEQLRQLEHLCRGYPIIIINKTISRSEVNALISKSDCLVSLHRAEGFGLTLAEAMYLGKPVISTAYSGNMDFTLPGNSFLVDFKLCAVGSGAEPYDPDQIWADPDLDSARAQMRSVVECVDLRSAKASAGKEFVHRFLSPEAVGSQMKSRLDRIVRTRMKGQHEK